MLCSTCGAENTNSLFCRQCRWQLVQDADAESATSNVRQSKRAPVSLQLGGIFSPAAWMELRLGSVFAWTHRGFSQRLKSFSQKKL
jgi:hypothetical protein